MSSIRFNLTVLAVSPLVLQSPSNRKVFGGKINLALISACSCPMVTLPHRASTAVNVETLLGRSCKGAGGGGDGCKGQACMLWHKHMPTYMHTWQTQHGGGASRKWTIGLWASVTTNICPADMPWRKIQFQECCSAKWPWPLTSKNFPLGINRSNKHTTDTHHIRSIYKHTSNTKPWAQALKYTPTQAGMLTLPWEIYCAMPKVTDLTCSDIFLVLEESICYRQVISSVQELLN